jgi:hypothetical protein
LITNTEETGHRKVGRQSALEGYVQPKTI